MADDPNATPPVDPPADPPSDPPADPPADPPSDPPADPPVTDWRDNLEGDERKFADRFPSPTDAVKFGFDARKKLSAALVQPADDASDEDRNEYHAKLGRPENAEGYAIAAPEDFPEHLTPPDEASMKRFTESMFAANAPAEVVKAASDWYYGEMVTGAADAETALNDYNAKGDAQLEKEWGTDFDKNIELGKRAFQTMPEALRGRLETMGFDADPEFKRYMATLGRNIGEDGMIDDGITTDKRDSLETKLKELEGSPNRWDKSVDAEITAIRSQLWPGNFQRNVA